MRSVEGWVHIQEDALGGWVLIQGWGTLSRIFLIGCLSKARRLKIYGI